MIPPVIIIHYHLKTGGVTNVVETQVDALSAAGIDYLVLSGEEYLGSKGIRQALIPKLSYLESTEDIEFEGKKLFKDCQKAVQERFGYREVIWHIHNPTIGKNILWPKLIECLANNQERVLLQCHDFAEDGRPDNYELTSASKNIYPVASNIHYACLNNRDLSFLKAAGIPKNHLHLLPNAISPPSVHKISSFTPTALILYPIRGIRRKNLGEFLLWSILAPEGTEMALTQSPVNSQWIPYYEVWESLAYELDLPVHLGCVDKLVAPEQNGSSYEDWLKAATHCITTSVAEGFGLTFLEPTALNIPLIGRDLPEITKTLKEENLPLGELYEKLLVPLNVINEDSLREDLHNQLESSYLCYKQQYKEKYLQKAWKHLTNDGYIDFGNLPEYYQVQIILKTKNEGFNDLYVQTSDGKRHDAREWIEDAIAPKFRISQSHTLYGYILEAYQKRLTDTYEKLLEKDEQTPSWINKEKVLLEFLAPERFHFLRT